MQQAVSSGSEIEDRQTSCRVREVVAVVAVQLVVVIAQADA